jgi:hypothetical protein
MQPFGGTVGSHATHGSGSHAISHLFSVIYRWRREWDSNFHDSTRTGLSIGALKVATHRAMLTLRKTLGRQSGEH